MNFRYFQEVRATLLPSKRHHILVRTGRLQIVLHYDDTKRTRPDTDDPWASLESYLRLDLRSTSARDILHKSRTRTSFPMHPYRCTRRVSEHSNHYGEYMRLHEMFFSLYIFFVFITFTDVDDEAPSQQLTTTFWKPKTTSARTWSLRQELKELHDYWASGKTRAPLSDR